MSGTFPIGTGYTPNWPAGYVPSAAEWSSMWSQKLDTDDPTLEGGPFLPLGGGHMAGELVLAGAPVNPLDAATKAYVDSITPAAGPFLPTAGGTMTGVLTLAGNPVGNLDAATRQYVDGVGTTANSALNVANAAVPKTGGSMSGPLTLSGNPTAPLGAATKQYVDQFLPLTGGTVNGSINVTSSLQGGSVYATGAFYANAFNGWEWQFTVDGNGTKYQTYRSGWSDYWNGLNGTRSWNAPGGSIMSLDGSGNLNVSGEVISGNVVSTGGNGVLYRNLSGHVVGFGWNGSINTYVDGIYEGDIALTSWVNSAFLPLGGGHINGSVDATNGFTSQGNISVNISGSGANFQFAPNYYFTLNYTNSDLLYVTNGNIAFYIGTDRVLNCQAGAAKPGGGVWSDNSDARLKDIHGDYSDGLEAILRLQPKRFSFNTDPDVEYVGFVGQDIEQVLPATVTKRRGMIDGVTVDDLRHVDATRVFYALVNAVQQLAAQVAALAGPGPAREA